MATSPQFPQTPRRGPHAVPKLQVPKKGFPWPLLAIIVAAAILIALIVWLPRTPHAHAGATGANVPAQPTPGQIQLSHLKMTIAPVGAAYYLEGMLFNNGNTDITGVQVQVKFVDNDGKVTGSQNRPVDEMNGRTDLSSQNLVDSPVKPGQSRPIRIYFDHPPANWNKQMPELTVTEVTATKP
ncbi:MAG TPA: DUF3426 domain-containing protein [Terriglobales bacterium]|nr:DUF3426 domain-containing protein [Terriglobales bacterium]